MTGSDIDRRRFRRAAAGGGLLGGLVFLWMVTAGTFDLFRWQLLGDFYDAQAHSLLAGHLAIDKEVLGIEAFLGRSGHSYMYQGPFPAVLRMPILALAGHRLDGRLTQLSMLAGVTVTVVFATRLHWTIRSLVRGQVAVGGGEALLVGLFTFVLAGGSMLTYEASRAWVYHEALVWGAALALVTLDRLLELVQRPTGRTLLWTCAAATATLLTRASIGIAPLAALAMVAAGTGLVRLARRRGKRWPLVRWLAPNGGEGRQLRTWTTVLATVVPLAAYAVVNVAKFERLFSIPFAGQRFTVVDPGRQHMLAVNHGTLFGLQFVPTTLVQYLRPDRIRLTRLFPYVDFPSFPGPLVGHVVFDLVDRTVSLPAAVPFLFLLALVGLAHVFRPRRWSDPARSALRLPVLAAGAGAATVLPFGYIANRYLGDFLPVLVLTAAVGLQVVIGATSDLRPDLRPTFRRAGAGALVLLAAWTAWVNVGLGLRYQRQWSSNIDAAQLAGFLGFQDDAPKALGGHGLPPLDRVALGAALPNGVGRAGALAVAGDCDALYLSDGMSVNNVKLTPWNGVERSEAGGRHRFRFSLPRRPQGTIVPIFTGGTPTEPYGLVLEYVGGDQVRLDYRAAIGLGRVERPYHVEFDHPYDLDLFADPRINRLSVRLGDRTVIESFFTYTGELHFGTDRVSGGAVFGDVEPTFPGTLAPVPVTTPLCRRLLARR